MTAVRHGRSCVLVAACVLVWATPALAQAPVGDRELGAGVELHGGYDSNPRLAVSPNARRSGETALDGPGSSGVVGGLARAYGVWGREHLIGASLFSDARLYHSGAARHDTRVSGIAGIVREAWRLTLALDVGRYDASFGLDDAWYGALAPNLRWFVSRSWSLGVEGHAGFRRYLVGEQTNGDFGGALDLTLAQATWSLAFGADLDRRQSNDPLASRTQLTPFATFRAKIDALELGLRAATYARWFEQGDQDGAELTIDGLARYRVTGGLGVIARFGVGFARGQAEALRYERVVALLGMSFELEPQPQVQPLDRTRQGPARLRDRTTRFALCNPSAHEVAVVGTFNDWLPTPMQPTGDGCFAVELAVPPGRHRYQWSIDGALRRPDTAPAYAPDGFGGEDAVLIVPQ